MRTNLATYARVLLAGIARADEGQTLTEYALIIGVVAAALVAVLAILSGGITGLFNTVVSSFPGA